MYCKVDLDADGGLSLPSGGNIDLICPQCNAVWKFWVSVQLHHKLVRGGKYNAVENDSS